MLQFVSAAVHSSMGDPPQKGKFAEHNGKVVTYEDVDLFPKPNFHMRIWLPNPLGDASKSIEWDQKNCLKVSHLPLC